jgi:hypothetical protein
VTSIPPAGRLRVELLEYCSTLAAESQFRVVTHGLHAWKRWFIDICPPGIVFASPGTSGDLDLTNTVRFFALGPPPPFQTRYSMVGTLFPSVWSSKIYISTVRFTTVFQPIPQQRVYPVFRTFPSLRLSDSALRYPPYPLVCSHPVFCIETSNNVTHYRYRIMHAFKFSLIAVLSCIAMIGAIPVGNSSPAEAIARRRGLVRYVPY